MSAFIVSKRHIDYLVTFVATRGYTNIYHNGEHKEYTATEIGTILTEANYKSVNHRYSEDVDTPTYTHRVCANGPINAAQVIKAARCFEYQSCEYPEYKESLAKAIIEKIISMAIDKLPGYSDLEWDLPEWTADDNQVRRLF